MGKLIVREAEALRGGAKLGWDYILTIAAASAAFAVVIGAGYAVEARAPNWLGAAAGIAAVFGIAFWLVAIVLAAPLAAIAFWLAGLLGFRKSLLFFLLLGVVCSFPMAILLDAALRPLSVSPGMVSVQTAFALEDMLALLKWTVPACVMGAVIFWARTRRMLSN